MLAETAYALEKERLVEIDVFVALYGRLSCDDASEGGSSSIESQKELLRLYARENNYNIVDYYMDDGYSGTNFNRPQFLRMIEDIKKGKVNMVVCKDFSRFGLNRVSS